MIRYKEYKTFKTSKKTAKENNLIIAEKVTNKDITRLFDFSFLDAVAITDTEKEVIKNDALKHVSGKPYNTSYYGKVIDNFTWFDGVATYNIHNVYNTSGKLLYRIIELAELTHKRCTRKSIYEKYTISTTIAHRVYDQPINDIEL